KMFMAILALAGVSSLFMPVRVFAQNTDGMVQEMIPERAAVTRAARLHTAQDPAATADPDTIWIGHIYDPTFTAINNGGNPTMQAGGYGPYHVGRGPKRTFGVTGLWHRDRGNTAFAPGDTVAGHNVQPVGWSPTEVGGAGSTACAWMGLRSTGDISAVDLLANGGTGNAFNGDLLQYQGNNGFNQVGSVSVNGTDHNFPGYGSQMDQMLYRDINS